MRSDLSLIHAAKRGDGEAFEHLVDRYANVLFRFALRFASTPARAEELAHDTLVDFYRQLDKYEPRAALGTYLCAILRRKALYARRQQKRSPLPLGPEEPDVRGSPQDCLLRNEELRQLKAHVDGLEDPLRLVVELHYMEGLKLREISEVLSLPLGTVKSRLNAALKSLRTGLSRRNCHEA